jgi:hypothetical protein
MDGSVDIGIGLCVIIVHRIDHDLWFLSCCGIVEVDEGVAMDHTLQNWEVVSKGHTITF